MKQTVIAIIAFAALAIAAPTASAYTSPGAPTGHVNDFAGVLSAETKQTLETELTQFQATTTNEIAVVTIPDMGGDYIENYAVELFAEWGIGKKDKDNGVLLLLAIKEHKMRIEVGYGLEGALPDSVAQSILNDEMTPLLKAGKYDEAVTAGVRAIEQATQGEYTASVEDSGMDERTFKFWAYLLFFGFAALQFIASILARSRSWWAGGILGFLGGLGIGWYFALGSLAVLSFAGVLTLVGLLFDYVVSAGYKRAKARGIQPPWWTGGSGGISGSSGSSFGGFGGGSSGGGGASGSW